MSKKPIGLRHPRPWSAAEAHQPSQENHAAILAGGAGAIAAASEAMPLVEQTAGRQGADDEELADVAISLLGDASEPIRSLEPVRE